MAEYPIESASGEGRQAAVPNLEELMLAYQQADRRSAELLMEALVPILSRFFMSTTDGRQNRDDLVQETLLRVHKARHSYRRSDPLLPWVFAIARHAKVDQFRKRHRTAQHESAVEQEALERHPAAEAPANEAPADFRSLVSCLPESQRQVLTMLKVFGMSVEEVARATSSTAGSVKQKAHRAYDRLRMVLRNPGSAQKGVPEKR